MHFRFMVARVGQFLIGHFPTGVYLHRFGYLPSPLSEGCRVPNMRAHVLLDCTRWAFQRERLWEWLQSEKGHATEEGETVPTWGWDFLVGTTSGKLWLVRFLTAIKSRWTMRDQLHADSSDNE